MLKHTQAEVQATVQNLPDVYGNLTPLCQVTLSTAASRAVPSAAKFPAGSVSVGDETSPGELEPRGSADAPGRLDRHQPGDSESPPRPVFTSDRR